ncbi:MAG: Rho GTPase activation protein [Piptocephalis tieghemiana]|nr:MAG: Rho GTPase activation protein [Piptocephalis tieghemiana]
MTIEGIYRKTGPNSQLRAILVCLARDEMPDLTDSTEHPDITSVTSALKLYLRELPEPLLTYELYPQFIDAARSVDSSDPRASLDRFRSLLLALPRGHRTTLAFLMAHLSRVQAQHEINLMTTKNLGVVFGPTLMRTTDPDRELLEMGTKNAVVEYIIEYADELLGTAK